MPQACANCEAVLIGTPFETEGAIFCCAGCAAGGPCQCTYMPEAPPALGAVTADSTATSSVASSMPSARLG
jgi:hypothetical protein